MTFRSLVLSSQDKSAKCLPFVLGFHVLSCVSVQRSERISQCARTRASQINCLLRYQRLPDILVRHCQYGFLSVQRSVSSLCPGENNPFRNPTSPRPSASALQKALKHLRSWIQHEISLSHEPRYLPPWLP